VVVVVVLLRVRMGDDEATLLLSLSTFSCAMTLAVSLFCHSSASFDFCGGKLFLEFPGLRLVLGDLTE